MRLLSVKSVFFFLLTLLTLASCKKNDISTSNPEITRIRTVSKDSVFSSVVHQVTLDSTSTYDETKIVAFDSTVTSGSLATMYAIIGKNLSKTTSITLNGVSLYFNQALVTDTSIIFTMPDSTTWEDLDNKLIVTTLSGSTSVAFSINQPAPTITSFTPVSGSSGDTVTITGKYFINVDSVLFNTTAAKIISSTATQLVVVVPANVVTAYISVVTAGGKVTSTAQFGFKYLVYADAITSGWNVDYGWSCTVSLTESTIVKRGTYSVSVAYTSGWGGAQFYNTNSAISLTGYTALKFSIYGGTGSTTGNYISVVLNGDYNNPVKISITKGAWTNVSLNLSSFSSPSTLTSIVFQEFSGVEETIYLDDIGLL